MPILEDDIIESCKQCETRQCSHCLANTVEETGGLFAGFPVAITEPGKFDRISGRADFKETLRGVREIRKIIDKTFKNY